MVAWSALFFCAMPGRSCAGARWRAGKRSVMSSFERVYSRAPCPARSLLMFFCTSSPTLAMRLLTAICIWFAMSCAFSCSAWLTGVVAAVISLVVALQGGRDGGSVARHDRVGGAVGLHGDVMMSSASLRIALACSFRRFVNSSGLAVLLPVGSPFAARL